MGDYKKIGKIKGKEIVLAILFIAVNSTAFLLWRMSIITIANGLFSSYTHFIISIATFVLATIFFGVATIFIKNPAIIYFSTIAATIIPFLLIPISPAALLVMIGSIFLIMFAVRRIRKEFDLSRSFSVAQLFKAGVPIFMTVAGMTTSMYYFTDIQTKDAIKTIFPRTAFNITIQVLGGPLRSLAGNLPITPDDTVDTMIQDLIKNQLDTKGIRMDQVSNSELQRLYTAQRDEIARSYGIKLTGREKLGDVFYTTIVDRISDLLGPYRQYVPYVSAFTFFFAFKTISLLFYFLALACAFVLIKLMILANILTREKQQIEIEQLTLR